MPGPQGLSIESTDPREQRPDFWRREASKLKRLESIKQKELVSRFRSNINLYAHDQRNCGLLRRPPKKKAEAVREEDGRAAEEELMTQAADGYVAMPAASRMTAGGHSRAATGAGNASYLYRMLNPHSKASELYSLI